jgi:TRAP-type C4-dicarboxylate transport system substrate-binding protein
VFTQKDLPTSNTVFDLQTTGTDTVAVAGAATETVMLHCPDCLSEYRKHKAVFLAGYGTTPFRLMCSSAITKVADLQGKKVRATGGASHLFARLGAITVNIPPNEGVEAMQRGAVDCGHGPHAWLQSYGFMDVTKHVIDYSFGFPRALGMFVMNRDAWNSLSLEQKKIMLKHMPAASARATIVGYIGEDEESKKAARGKGIQFHKAGKDFDEVMAKYRVEERKRVVEGAKAMGAKDAEKMAQAFEKVLPKWESLSKDIGDNVGKFAAALQKEIYDKLDPAKM